jgi:hypothetical protein
VFVEHDQGSPVGHVLAPVQQGSDPLRIDLKGRNLLPQPRCHRGMGQLDLGCRKLAHQQKHQLLFLAFGEAAIEAATALR